MFYVMGDTHVYMTRETLEHLEELKERLQVSRSKAVALAVAAMLKATKEASVG